MDVLILAYHGEPGLRKLLKGQPVDVIEKAAMWLKAQGYEKIGLWGVSMGGCLALLAGSLLPELISCVVASAPMEMVPQAEDSKCPIPGSAFSFHGRSLPYIRYIPDGKAWKKAFLKETLRHKEPCTIIGSIKIGYCAVRGDYPVIPAQGNFFKKIPFLIKKTTHFQEKMSNISGKSTKFCSFFVRNHLIVKCYFMGN